MNLPTGLATSLRQRGDEPFSVKIIMADWLPAVATVHHLIAGNGIFNAPLPRHESVLNVSPPAVKINAGLTLLQSGGRLAYPLTLW